MTNKIRKGGLNKSPNYSRPTQNPPGQGKQPEDQDETIDRLIKEIRYKDKTLEDIQQALRNAKYDLERLTMAGAVKHLASDRDEANKRVEELEKELDKLIKKSVK